MRLARTWVPKGRDDGERRWDTTMTTEVEAELETEATRVAQRKWQGPSRDSLDAPPVKTRAKSPIPA